VQHVCVYRGVHWQRCWDAHFVCVCVRVRVRVCVRVCVCACAQGDQLAALIGSSLARNTTLTSLNLPDNMIGDGGFGDLADRCYGERERERERERDNMIGDGGFGDLADRCYVCMYVRVCMHACMCLCMCLCALRALHTHRHTHTHSLTHTHTHAACHTTNRWCTSMSEATASRGTHSQKSYGDVRIYISLGTQSRPQTSHTRDANATFEVSCYTTVENV
jgi:hypothetical protein